MEVERTNCASKGMAGTGLGLGIAGTALGLLNGGLGGLWGGAVPMAAAQVACSENTGVNRFELEQERTISNKDMEIAYWRGQDRQTAKSLMHTPSWRTASTVLLWKCVQTRMSKPGSTCSRPFITAPILRHWLACRTRWHSFRA